MSAPQHLHLNDEMQVGLHSLKHGRWLSRSMAAGLTHYGYAQLVDGEYQITERGLDYLERAGTCWSTRGRRTGEEE
jgi:hypothetical protein